jgi:hypothetical protein
VRFLQIDCPSSDGKGQLSGRDRDTKFCTSFRSVLAEDGVKTIPLPARSPNLNAFAERWVRSVKQACLSKLILFGERPLLRALAEFSARYHHERNHQGKGDKLLLPHAGDEPRKPGHTVAVLGTQGAEAVRLSRRLPLETDQRY